MKVALLTLFNGLAPTYSLVNVVAEQLEMLLSHHISVKLLVSEDCPLSDKFGIFLDERIEWVHIVNHIDSKPIKWYDYSNPIGSLHDSFLDEAKVIAADLVSSLYDIDVCILHDILFQGWHYIHNIALRIAQPHLLHTRFLSFTHSFPAKRPSIIDDCMKGRYTPLPNTTYIYPTYSGIPALSKQYQIPEGLCRVVYNSLSPFSFLAPEVLTLHSQVNLLTSDILIIYPGRLTPAKKFEKIAALAGSIYTHTEKSVTVIYCDFPSSDIDSNFYKSLIYKTASEYGLPQESVAFTSDLGFPQGFPRKGVLDLFTLSNIFICPSFSESFGLTVLEAASRGNLLVLNENVPALFELGDRLHAYFLKWDAKDFDHDILQHYPTSEFDYYKRHAKIIIQKLYQNEILFAKTQTRLTYSPEWIWHNQLQPLLYS